MKNKEEMVKKGKLHNKISKQGRFCPYLGQICPFFIDIKIGQHPQQLHPGGKGGRGAARLKCG